MGDKTSIVISDDEGVNEPVLLKEKEDGNMEEIEELPDWLPDGWTMEVFRTDEGIINRYYTSPISDYTFTDQAEVLEYLFSGVDERILQSKECGVETKLHITHQWLPKGWVMEVRAGGENMDMMYKFYVQPGSGVRLLSKEDVLLYLKEAKISSCDTNGQCDISSNDNMLAKVELNPTGLPKGWVKELAFRKTKEGSVRRDPYYTDPSRGYTFRTLKSAVGYLESGKVSKRAFIQSTSVHDIYSFDKCANLHEFLRSRLTINWKTCRKPTRSSLNRKSSHIDHDRDTDSSADDDTSTGLDSSSEPAEENVGTMKSADKEATCSKTVNHPKGKPQKFLGKIKKDTIEDQDAV